jgi:outer membrane receptor protein involved in Fe transport
MNLLSTHRLKLLPARILYFILFIAAAATTTARAQSSQLLNQRISLQLADVKIKDALKQIERQVNCSFVYSNNLIKSDQRITRKFSNESLSAVLSSIIGIKRLQLRVDNRQIYIKAAVSGDQVISGQVTSDGQSIPGAKVSLSGNSAVVTDNNGDYLLKGLTAGDYQITVNSIGSGTASRNIRLPEGENLKVDFKLEQGQQQLTEVAVIGKNESQKNKESGFNMNVLETGRFNNSTRDLNQLLNATTGVRIREQGGLGSNFNFSLNGLSGKAVRFFIDGIPMENYGAGMTFNNIPVNLASRLEVFKGVVPVELGADAMGGAVNVVTNKGTRNYLDAAYSIGSFNTHRASLNTQYHNQKSGLVLRLTGFYNYSDNDYTMRSNPKYDAAILVPDGSGNFIEKDVRRFHDQFRSAMIQGEAGLVNKKWADVFMLSLLYNNHYKQFQTGATQNTVYGKVDRRGDFFMPAVRYKKDNLFVKGLSATAYLSYGIDKYKVADTSSYTYWWDGSRRSEIKSDYGEFGGGLRRTLIEYQNNFLLGRVNLQYDINDQHAITLNYNYNRADRESYDEWNDKAEHPSSLSKNVYGLAWKSQFMDGRLKNTVFGKAFLFQTGGMQTLLSDNGSPVSTDNSKSYNKYGGGLSSRLAVTKNAGLRFSYEHTYRLPEQVELLGDGVNIVANLDIKPESSHNINLGLDYTIQTGKNQFIFDASGFIRNASDFIYSIPWGANASKYLNEGKVLIKGIEAEAQYRYADLLTFNVNASYVKSKQNQQYVYGTTSEYVTYGNMIPNQPWLFGNALLSVGKNGLAGKGTRLQFDWSSQYVHWFYLTWEGYGSSQSKNQVPSQFIHNAGVTYSMLDGKYNLALECRNLTDELAYDSFRLQKPPRSFNIKFRYSL